MTQILQPIPRPGLMEPALAGGGCPRGPGKERLSMIATERPAPLPGGRSTGLPDFDRRGGPGPGNPVHPGGRTGGGTLHRGRPR